MTAATPIDIQTSIRPFRTSAIVTPAAEPNCSAAAKTAVPASSMPIRSGTNLKTTVMNRLAASKTRASARVTGRSLSRFSMTATSATASTWNAHSSAVTPSRRRQPRG